jgi:BlaI family penicillinase repressor
MIFQKPPTDSELEILQVLWAEHPQSVRFVNETLNTKKENIAKEIGYTTTLKIMQMMLDKGLLERDTTDRTHLYSPAIAQEITQNQVLAGVMNTAFGGSTSNLVMRALGSGDTSPEELAKIKAMIVEIENQALTKPL